MLDEAQADRASALRKRDTARQAHERASASVERLQRKVRDLSGTLDRLPPLSCPARRVIPAFRKSLARQDRCQPGGGRNLERVRQPDQPLLAPRRPGEREADRQAGHAARRNAD